MGTVYSDSDRIKQSIENVAQNRNILVQVKVCKRSFRMEEQRESLHPAVDVDRINRRRSGSLYNI